MPFMLSCIQNSMMYNIEMVKIIITENESNQRLDKFLKKYFKNATLNHIYKLLRKDVKVNGKRVSPDTRILAGDEIIVYVDEKEAMGLVKPRYRERSSKGMKRPFAIAYEDDHVLIAEKPPGLLIHGTQSEKKSTLTNWVIDYLISHGEYSPRLSKTFVPASVNRLDRNTSGLVIFGKNYGSLKSLNRMMSEGGHIFKYYLAIVKGEVERELCLKGTMEKNETLNRVKVHGLEDDKDGKMMETLVRPIEVRNGYSFIEAELITGRTHQIRAQLAAAGYPIIGDGKYGSIEVNKEMRRRFDLSSQYLHAYKLSFENCIEPLKYMSGLQIVSHLPPFMMTVKETLFSR